MKTEDNKYESIATKIAAAAKGQLDDILQGMDINLYQWFQLMAEVTIRMRDDRHQLSEPMSRLIQMFQMVPNYKNPATFLDPNVEPEVKGAIYFVAEKGKVGYKPVMVEKDWIDGLWTQTENAMDIVEKVLEVALPQKYKWLRKQLPDTGCSRVFELLMKLADEASRHSLTNEIAELFGDNMRGPNARPVAYGERTKRKKKYTTDSKGFQRIISFEQGDTPEDSSNY